MNWLQMCVYVSFDAYTMWAIWQMIMNNLQIYLIVVTKRSEKSLISYIILYGSFLRALSPSAS